MSNKEIVRFLKEMFEDFDRVYNLTSTERREIEMWLEEKSEETGDEFLEMKEKAEKYDEIMARRKAHAKKMVANKSKEWLHERAVKANNARWGKKGNKNE